MKNMLVTVNKAEDGLHEMVNNSVNIINQLKIMFQGFGDENHERFLAGQWFRID